MATIWTPPNQFAAFLGERIGFKSGLALSREEIIEHLTPSNPIASVISSLSDEPVRLRSNEILDAFQILLHRLGCLGTPFVGHGPTLLDIKYQADPVKHDLFEQVLALLGSLHFDKGHRSLEGFDKRQFFEIVRASLPFGALELAVELVDLIELSERASPWAWQPARQVDWREPLDLQALFASESLSGMHGSFIDQRFIDYLSANFEKIGEIHWRKFEALTAEFFARNGYRVDIGPGRNDGGIDVRVWASGTLATDPPAILIQCKRQKAKIDKVIVKALWADVVNEGATSGLIVTSSSLSPGADTVRRARSYPIDVADRSTVRGWIEQLKSPGRGIFFGW